MATGIAMRLKVSHQQCIISLSINIQTLVNQSQQKKLKSNKTFSCKLFISYTFVLVSLQMKAFLSSLTYFETDNI